jgi:methylated-DNA-protein-cysteine methyltransferase-like protein
MPNDFKENIQRLVAQIPHGKVMTYGQLAALAGSPRAARIVGGIAHYGDPDLPWHRVVNRHGGFAKGYPGGREAHRLALESEGVAVNDDVVDLDVLLWRPE